MLYLPPLDWVVEFTAVSLVHRFTVDEKDWAAEPAVVPPADSGAPLSAAQVGLVTKFDLLMVWLLASVKLVDVAVKDQPAVPPRASATVIGFNLADSEPVVTAEVMLPKLTTVLLEFVEPFEFAEASSTAAWVNAPGATVKFTVCCVVHAPAVATQLSRLTENEPPSA